MIYRSLILNCTLILTQILTVKNWAEIEMSNMNDSCRPLPTVGDAVRSLTLFPKVFLDLDLKQLESNDESDNASCEYGTD